MSEATKKEMAYYNAWAAYTQIARFVDQIGTSLFDVAINRERGNMNATRLHIRNLDMGLTNLMVAVDELQSMLGDPISNEPKQAGGEREDMLRQVRMDVHMALHEMRQCGNPEQAKTYLGRAEAVLVMLDEPAGGEHR